MITEIKDKLETEKLNLCLSGFGVGFSWGSCLITTEKIICLPLIELL
ncbi:MAG: ketoacyl-ACP synthase III, partial [Bacteroidia bacterium]|nr:ketoacyl-ACP synthase III [Bacteroidia bacterium]